MTTREATMLEILDNRERRVIRQRQLLAQYGNTLVCFTMNIPGPIKNNDWIYAGFQLGKQRLLDVLKASNIPLLHQEEICTVTGCEGFFLADAPARRVKTLTVQLEDDGELGRLFDMDVLSPAGEKYSREELGLPERKCLLCGNSARVCGPIRAHSAGALWQKTQELLQTGIIRERSQHIGAMASKALLYEVGVTPKPGLVDRNNCGAHRDMDIFTFFGSTAVLQPYFTRCAQIGIETREDAPEETFRKIRLAGMLAEGEMLRQTKGVNTHKGAIFSLGIACAAAGRLGGQCPLDTRVLLQQCGAMTAGIVRRDFQNLTTETAKTAGERFYGDFGITGIRGQAEAGFPAVKEYGLPVLEKGLETGHSLDRAAGAALLAILAHTDDTNLIARSNRDTQIKTARSVAQLLLDTPYPETEVLEALDQSFTEANLSPGGSADLLALTLLVHFLSRQRDHT